MIENIKKSKFGQAAEKFFSSDLYLYTLSILVLVSHFLAIETFIITLIIISMIYINLFQKDTLPLTAGFLLIVFCASLAHAPGYGDGKDYFLYTPRFTYFIVLFAFFVLSIIFRIVYYKNFFNIFKKTGITSGLVLLSCAFFLAGVMSDFFSFANLWFAAMLTGSYLIVFLFFSATSTADSEKAFLYLAKVSLLAAAIITLELIGFYIVKYTPGTVLDMNWKGGIDLGWGVSNVIGELIVITMPMCFYAARKFRFGWPYYIFAAVLMIAVYFTLSRAALLASVFVFGAGAIYTCFDKARRKMYIIFASVIAAVLIVGFITVIKVDELSELISYFSDRGVKDSGRFTLWEHAVVFFKNFPFFGAGFFAQKEVFGGATIFQTLFHDVVFQVLGSMGIFGLLAFVYHLTEVAGVFLKKPSSTRLIFGLSCAAFWVISLLDIIYAMPYVCFYYIIFLVYCEKDLRQKTFVKV